MKKLLNLSMLSLALATSAFAGPSDGTGTNIVVSENELSDFVKFRKEYGKISTQIRPRTFRRNGQIFYQEIKSLIERAENIYPGMGVGIEKAYDLPWIVVDAKFASRSEKETKPISQTDKAIFISSEWIKSASPEQIQKAFLHEGVRKLAKQILDPLSPELPLEFEDDLTEALTPALFEKRPFVLLEDSLNKSLSKAISYAEKNIPETKRKPISTRIMGRAEIYELVKKLSAIEDIRRICNQSMDLWNIEDKIDAAANSLHYKMRIGNNFRYVKSYDGKSYYFRGPRPLDEGAAKVVEIIIGQLSGYKQANAESAKEHCAGKKFEPILKEIERADGKTGAEDEGVDELPGEQEKPAEAPAK